MRKPHPSYELFMKEQKPKYEKTFIEWFSENQKIGDIDLLSELQKRNQHLKKSEFEGIFDIEYVTYFKDFFTKKLQLCQNLIGSFVFSPISYGIDTVADIMDLYEDLIQEICTNENIYITTSPNGIHNNRTYVTENYMFENYDEFIKEVQTGIIIIYCFKIFENKSIEVRYFKREPLTRKVIFERTEN